MSDSRVRDFIEKINKAYDGGVCELGGRFKALKMRRFSSGILSLDCALGGGWPFGRISVVAGEYSTGKTLIALKAIEQVEQYDHDTKLHRSEVEPDKFSAGRALFVDIEGSFDLEWAKANGFNADHHIVARPEYAEQAVDIVTDAIRQNVVDLIVLDSIANMTPTAEIEESTEDWQMGLAARLINKAMRRWNASLNRLSQDVGAGPLVMCLNQFRLKIGVMYGDPRTLPGGKGQEFCSSIIVYTKSPKIEDGEDKETAFVEMSGTTHKNKTYVPKLNYTFKMSLKAQPDWGVGQVDNIKQLLKLGKQTGAIVVEKNKVICGVVVTKTQKELAAKLSEDKILTRSLWQDVLRRMTV
jgi:recombination protein RecA